MVTKVPPLLYGVYKSIAPYLSTEQRSGIANAASPGYHTSPEDLMRQNRYSDYSVQCPADKRGNAVYATGIDITLGPAEMRLVTTRLRIACTPDSAGMYDARIECLREFIGSLDGKNVCGYNRVATGSGSRSRVGWVASGFSDSSHRWHVHISVLRDRVEIANDMLGLAEVICGLKPGTLGWKGAIAVPQDPPKPEVPFVWDGKSYPGPQHLTVGAIGPQVTHLGERLVKHGYGGYKVGPGPEWGQADTDGVVWFKRQQGWSGGPTVGEATWELLEADPVPLPEWQWDGKSYPGIERLKPGIEGKWVTLLGQRLEAHGYKGYKIGPGPNYGPSDDSGVVWFKRRQGWTGGPRCGETTWNLLMADPVTPPVLGKPGWRRQPTVTLQTKDMPSPVTYLQSCVRVAGMKTDDGTVYREYYVMAQDINNAGNTRFVLFDENGGYVGWMLVKDGGHAQSFHAYRSAAGNLYIWTLIGETAYRIKWQSGFTVDANSTGIEKADFKGATPVGTREPYIGWRTANATHETFYLHNRVDFLQGKTEPLKTVTVKKQDLQQSRAFDNERIYRLYGKTNQNPGEGTKRHVLDVLDWNGNILLNDFDLTDMTVDTTSDEPECVTFDRVGNVQVGKREGGKKANRSYPIWNLINLP